MKRSKWGLSPESGREKREDGRGVGSRVQPVTRWSEFATKAGTGAFVGRLFSNASQLRFVSNAKAPSFVCALGIWAYCTETRAMSLNS